MKQLSKTDMGNRSWDWVWHLLNQNFQNVQSITKYIEDQDVFGIKKTINDGQTGIYFEWIMKRLSDRKTFSVTLEISETENADSKTDVTTNLYTPQQ